MSARLPYHSVAPAAYQAMQAFEQYVRGSGLEMPLLELVKMRASQINGCAYCLDLHSKDALAAGETAQRLLVLSAWREAPMYTPRERAALAWTEAVTHLGAHGVPDVDYQQASTAFTPEELVNLTMAVIAINGWNRLSIAFQSPEPGSYVVRARSGKSV